MSLVGAPAPELEETKVELSAVKAKAAEDLQRLMGDDMNEDTDDESYAEEDDTESVEGAEEALADEAAAVADEDSMEESESESEKEEDGEVEMEEVIDVVRDSEIPLSYAKDGIFNPTQVLRSGKQVFSELRATTIEKGEFESDEEDAEYEESDDDSESIVEDTEEVEADAEETAEVAEGEVQEDEEDDEEDEEPEFDEPVTAEEFKEMVTESGHGKGALKSSKVLRNAKEIVVDENVEDLAEKIQEMLKQ